MEIIVLRCPEKRYRYVVERRYIFDKWKKIDLYIVLETGMEYARNALDQDIEFEKKHEIL